MVLPPLYVDNMDEVPEAHKDDYTPGPNGGFICNFPETGGFSVVPVAGLQNTIRSLRDELAADRKTLANYRDPDGELQDPAKIAAALKLAGELGEDTTVQAKVEAAVRDRLADAERRQAAIVSEKDKRVESLMSQLSERIVGGELMRALSDSSDNRTPALAPDMLAKALSSECRMVEKDGQFGVEVVENGQPKIGPDGQNVSIQSFVDSIRKDRPEMFRAPERKGIDGPRRPGIPNPGGPGDNATKLTPIQKLQAVHSKADTA